MYGRDEREIEKRKYLAIMLERTLVSINMVMKRDNVKRVRTALPDGRRL